MGPISPELYRRYRALSSGKTTQPLNSEQRCRLRSARGGAKRRGIPFLLSQRDFEVLIARAAGRCEMTGIAFSDEPVKGQRVRPYRLSIDRLNNNLGYSLDNCRLVCAFANLARGAMSLELAHQLFLEYARFFGVEIPDRLVADRHPDKWSY